MLLGGTSARVGAAVGAKSRWRRCCTFGGRHVIGKGRTDFAFMLWQLRPEFSDMSICKTPRIYFVGCQSSILKPGFDLGNPLRSIAPLWTRYVNCWRMPCRDGPNGQPKQLACWMAWPNWGGNSNERMSNERMSLGSERILKGVPSLLIYFTGNHFTISSWHVCLSSWNLLSLWPFLCGWWKWLMLI